LNLLISACLLGCSCRYDGKDNGLPLEILCELQKKYTLIPVCPEIYGGLSTPRPPAEILHGKVMNCEGADVTAQYEKGAREALKIAEKSGCKAALMKERSPSCGCGQIYDGTFSKKLVDGDGVAAALLKRSGIKVFGESSVEKFLLVE